MHVSLKQIQMMTTFDKYNLLLLYNNNHYIYILKYVVKEINLLFFKCVQIFCHKSKRKGRKDDSSSSSQVCSGTSTDLFAVMVLLNFYLHVLIHYYFTTSFDIFYHCFYLQGTLAFRHRQEAFLEALNDEGDQQMAGAAQLEAPEESEVRATQQEAPEKPEVGGAQQSKFEEVDDQSHVTYRLVKF
jgi:hypothetical protein